jgi:predicted amidohydrolase YtcJ
MMTTHFSKPMNPFLISFLLTIISVAEAGQAIAADLIIQNTTVVSPERSTPLHHASVLIRDGKIEAVSEQPIRPKANTQVLDGSNLFLKPSLMDSHLHTLVIPGLGSKGGQCSQKFARMTELYEQQFERSLLYFGVTQILDPAAHPATLALSQNRALTPDIFHCGAAPLATGYPTNFMDTDAIDNTLPYRIYENTPTESSPHNLDLSQHTPEAVVRRMSDGGAICLKLFFEDGWDLINDWPMLSDESIERVIHAAHAKNLKVIGHANALDM